MKNPLIIGSNGFVAAIDRESGRELWRTALKQGVMGGRSRTGVSVLVVDGQVFAGSYGHLFCLDLESGAVLWKNEMPSMGYNDVSLAVEGVSIQFLKEVIRSHSHAST